MGDSPERLGSIKCPSSTNPVGETAAECVANAFPGQDYIFSVTIHLTDRAETCATTAWRCSDFESEETGTTEPPQRMETFATPEVSIS